MYVASRDEAALNESVPIGPRLDPLVDEARPHRFILTHVVSHGTQHRSELARYFTECGHSPDQLDLIDAPYLTTG